MSWAAGIDVSHWQTPGTYPPDTKYAWVKVSQGGRSKDTQRKAHHRELGVRGIARGPYHFYDFGVTPEANAANMLAAAAGLPWELPYVLDAEKGDAGSKAATADVLLRFLQLVQRDTGRIPVVYTYASWWTPSVAVRPEFARFPLWIARYPNAYKDGTQPPAGKTTTVPAPWSTHAVWQYSDTNGHLDRNVCTPQALANLTGTSIPNPPDNGDDDMYEKADRDRDIATAKKVDRIHAALFGGPGGEPGDPDYRRHAQLVDSRTYGLAEAAHLKPNPRD